jgi:DNA-directed RNA polymerase specialized sigma subunit
VVWEVEFTDQFVADSCQMPKTKNFRILEERARQQHPGFDDSVAVIKQAIEDVLELDEIRRRRGLTQVQVAGRLGISQGNVSQLEHRTELYLSTLREYVEALGGHLELVAVFPDEAIQVSVAGGTTEPPTRATPSTR